jgi:nitrogen fixation protein NifZ
VLVDPNTPLQDNVNAQLSGRDEPEAKFKEGQKVKLLEDIKNDGTYPHSPIGEIMMSKGSIGYIKKIGEFLQVIRVYEVHFMGTPFETEIIGCREHELESMEDDGYVDEAEQDRIALEEHRKRMAKN